MYGHATQYFWCSMGITIIKKEFWVIWNIYETLREHLNVKKVALLHLKLLM